MHFLFPPCNTLVAIHFLMLHAFSPLEVTFVCKRGWEP